MPFPKRNSEENVVPEDGLFTKTPPTVRLSQFEGPLDLLLFLIRKNEIDIRDIPIVEITRQYMEILHENEEHDLEIAGDFFVMAATLMHIKSRVLLPSSESAAGNDNAEEELDPRWALVKQLIEYKRLKKTAGYIEKLLREQQNFLPREIAVPEIPEERPLAPLEKMELWNVFNTILRRLSDLILPGEIHDDSVTISARMEAILEKLKSQKTFTFSSLMPEKISIQFLATTFLACLELSRLDQLF